METLPITALPNNHTPKSWLASVLPCSREIYDHHLTRAKRIIEDQGYDSDHSFAIQDERGPLGMTVITGTDEKRQLELIAIRGDRRQQGYGKQLLAKTIEQIKKKQAQSLTVSSVSTAHSAFTHLLESFNFEMTTTSGIRMRRSLDIPIPTYNEPEGFTIRALKPGEEEAWVHMKNEAFGDEGGKLWTLDNFHSTFTNEPCCDYNRIFVALKDDHMVATTSAWEANYGEGPVGLIHWVGTDPKFRGHGLGYALNVRALEELAARGYAEAWLNTALWRKAAVKLYEKLDFTIHRRTVHYTLDLT